MVKTSIFLSSTVEDMQKERDSITDVITSLGKHTSRCEYYPARTQSPKEVCLNQAATCDIFIGIYKTKYGFIPTENNPEFFSVIEMEYMKAKEFGVPLLLFVHSDSKNRDPKLTNFIQKIKNFSDGHYVKTFKTIDNLKYLVLHSLVFELLNSDDFKDSERISLQNLIPDSIKYKNAFLKNYSFDSITGIIRASIPLDYKLEDLYVPPELEEIGKIHDDTTHYPTPNSFAPDPSLNWNEIENFIKKESKNQITTGINIQNTLTDLNPTIILGDGGIGKSTLLKYFCCDLILNSSIIPIFVPVREFRNFMKNTGNNSILDYLYQKFRYMNLTQEFFERHLESGSCVIIFDGLDEVWDTEERRMINDIIQGFCSIWSASNKIFISSRKKGYYKNPLTIPNQQYEIAGFNREKISLFVLKWVNIIEGSSKQTTPTEIGESANRILTLIGETGIIAQLATIPLLLQIICLVFYKNPVLTKRRHQLYSNVIETIFS